MEDDGLGTEEEQQRVLPTSGTRSKELLESPTALRPHGEIPTAAGHLSLESREF